MTMRNHAAEVWRDVGGQRMSVCEGGFDVVFFLSFFGHHLFLSPFRTPWFNNDVKKFFFKNKRCILFRILKTFSVEKAFLLYYE